MGTVWFCLVAAILAGYVLLDGFDIGVGVIHLWIARDDAERQTVIRSIGPVWDGNEVWLVAAGGTLFFAFPLLYASSFSGFYLPLMIVLWLLILRGISLEARRHMSNSILIAFWDGTFALASTLLALFYGTALGNVVRGVPLDAKGQFFEPLWTNFAPFGQTGILDWYTVLAGLTALAALALHGAAWLAYKTDGKLNARAELVVSGFWWLVAALTALLTVVTFVIAPQLFANFSAKRWGFIFPLLAIGGLAGTRWFARRDHRAAFILSCVYLLGMLTSVAFGIFPDVLPASTNPVYALTIENAKASEHGLRVGLVWWIIGMVLALTYTAFVYHSFAGKVSSGGSEQRGDY